MLSEQLKKVTEIKEFNAISKPELARMDLVGRQLYAAMAGGAPLRLGDWRQASYDSIPSDVKPNVNVLSLTEPEPGRKMLQAYLGLIRDEKSSPEDVRFFLEAAYSRLAMYAIGDETEEQLATTPLGDQISYDRPRLQKRTLFPILRAALPAALSAGSVLRSLGCDSDFVTARIARPDADNYADLRYFVDDQLLHMPPDHICGRHVYIIDPLIAAGGSIIAAHSLMKMFGPKSVSVLSLCATSYGVTQVVRNLKDLGTDVRVYSVDIGHLDAKGYVRPGYGDIGDRLHGEEQKGKIRSLDELIGIYRPAELIQFEPEIDAIFAAAHRPTPTSLKPRPFTQCELESYDAGPTV